MKAIIVLLSMNTLFITGCSLNTKLTDVYSSTQREQAAVNYVIEPTDQFVKIQTITFKSNKKGKLGIKYLLPKIRKRIDINESNAELLISNVTVTPVLGVNYERGTKSCNVQRRTKANGAPISNLKYCVRNSNKIPKTISYYKVSAEVFERQD
jgi:hypothetical protein